MKLRILDRYIFREVLVTFFFSICAFSTVFIGSGTLFQIARYITDYGASLSSVVKIFVLGLPGVVMWTFPMSMLLASLLTMGRMSSSSEITAMKSCGVSFPRIAAPIILLGLVVSIFAMAFNEYVVPWANNAYQNVIYYEIKGNTGMKSQEHVILKDIKEGKIQHLAYARYYNADTNQLTGVTLQNFNAEGKVTQVENAEYAEWTGSSWTMHNGMIYDIQEGGDATLAQSMPRATSTPADEDTSQEESEEADEHAETSASHTMRFDIQTLPIATTPKQIAREQKSAEEMTMKELRAQIDIMKSQYVDTKKLETELYQRVTVPMASLIFALVGVPLGMQPTRNSSSAGFAMSVVIIFFYYALMTMGNALARGGILPALPAVWIPNIVGLIAGAILFRRASR